MPGGWDRLIRIGLVAHEVRALASGARSRAVLADSGVSSGTRRGQIRARTLIGRVREARCYAVVGNRP